MLNVDRLTNVGLAEVSKNISKEHCRGIPFLVILLDSSGNIPCMLLYKAVDYNV